MAFTWHPGQPTMRANHVEVTFNRMREAGYLVLAGPLADAKGEGEGMTILRLPGPDRLSTATTPRDRRRR